MNAHTQPERDPSVFINLGRGTTATADMKRRIKALKSEGADVIDTLWERNRRAHLGEGFSYEFAEDERAHAV